MLLVRRIFFPPLDSLTVREIPTVRTCMLAEHVMVAEEIISKGRVIDVGDVDIVHTDQIASRTTQYVASSP